MTTKGGKVSVFLRRNWFKFLIIGFIIFLMLKKDFSFQINLKSPLQQEEVPKMQEQIPVQKPAGAASTERYTDARSSQNEQEKDKRADLFQLNPIGGSGREAPAVLRQFQQLDEAAIGAFIKRFGHVAVSERKKYGIPASLILANGLLISKAGATDMVQNGNNYFALTCTDDWIGEQGFYGGDCFRHYENAWTSFRDHSLFLTTGKNAQLISIGRNDYEGWAKALNKAGFYPQSGSQEAIIAIVKKYQLDRFDRD